MTAEHPRPATLALEDAARTESFMHRRLRLSACLVLAGLVIETVSLLWSHPTAFLVFMFAGGLLLGAGILLFLHSLAARG